jgi:DNA-binding GntR family transcriptional regulator
VHSRMHSRDRLLRLTRLDPPQSLTALAVARLREAIVEGDLALGERLSETSLAAALGISKTPVREALARLQTEGLVMIAPRRGTFVFVVNAAEVRAISELRLTLEATALSLAISRNQGPFAAELGDVVEQMGAALARDDDRQYLRLDSAFHELFFRHCRNSYLEDAYSLIAGKIAALRTHLSVRPQQIEDSFDEHRGILEAAAAGKPKPAIHLLDHQVARMVQAFAEDDTCDGGTKLPQHRRLKPLDQAGADLPRAH